MNSKIYLFLDIAALLALSSCSLVFSNSVPSKTSKISTSSGNAMSSSSTQTLSGISIPDSFDENKVYNYSSLTALGTRPLNSIGTRHILVLPVYFTNVATFSPSEIDTIDNAYNGAASSTGWQSLKSFYETSSYGKLSIEATLLSPYCYSGTDADFQAYANKNGSSSATTYLGYLALKNLPSSFDYGPYDEDKDGYLDGFEMVYKSNLTWDGKNDSATSVWWNYTTSSNLGSGTAEKPNIGTFFWSQYSLLANGYYSPNIDSHTLIHETGHMLGLDDYYSYDNDGAPAGMCDIMDFNIGDHDAYSKMLLGWVNPMVVDGTKDDFSLTLRSFTESGDCVLLRSVEDPWNDTPYDEYLLLQYYTPTGLNYRDSINYPEWNRIGAYGNHGLYKKAGLQVFHVDARLINDPRITGLAYRYTDSPSKASRIAASNTPSSSIDVPKSALKGSFAYGSACRLLQAIPASGENVFYTSNEGYYNYLGYQKALFGLSKYGCGSTRFSFSSYSDFFPNGTSFNDGSTLEYSFEVTAQTDKSIDIHFSIN